MNSSTTAPDRTPNPEPSLAELARLAAASVETTRLEKTLRLTLDGQVYLARAGDVIGRQGTIAPERLATAETVSRRHVLIDHERGQWVLRVPASVLNSTRLDGVELPREQPVAVSGRHTLALGTAVQFLIEVTG